MSLKTSDLIAPEEVRQFRMFIFELSEKGSSHLSAVELLEAFQNFRRGQEESGFEHGMASIVELLNQTLEAIVLDEEVVLVHRHRIAQHRIYEIGIHHDRVEELSIRQLLDLKDRLVRPDLGDTDGKLVIDFMPFYDYGPRIGDPRQIGEGMEFLNDHMSRSLVQRKWSRNLLDFLKLHSLDHEKLLVDGSQISSPETLAEKLKIAVDLLGGCDGDLASGDALHGLKEHGFEPGWGDTARRIRETMQLLLDLLESPDSDKLEEFISRIPMTAQVVILSPHGWFGQENVLGRPDTGGQVVYILDQVRALERILSERLNSFGLALSPRIIILTRLIPENDGTTSHVRLEKVHFTDHTYILRVPFTDPEGNVVPHWLSRFEVWPYLERFAEDCYHVLLGELDGSPDLIIGNYSDGNMVATLLSRRFRVTQCSIAHALEKTKYEHSDLQWARAESEKHFSLQFMADLISMNMADFVITSTHQEIYGSQESPGQYESYQHFTLPGLMQVKNGVNLHHPKFNVIPPGVDEGLYFPFEEKERRLSNETGLIEARLFHDDGPGTVGRLDAPDRPALFTMARLDRIKNITGLVEAYATCGELRQRANLIVVAGKTDSRRSGDEEEIEGIERMHALFDEYGLDGQVRWLEAFSREAGAEAYRIVAERGGVFVQPAKFEGFGLTVLEAMVCGLPTFATRFGGPSEIIEDGRSGFLINPSVPELMSEPILAFFKNAEKDPELWGAISRGGVARVREAFTWDLYGNRLLNMTQLYGFWRYSVASEGKEEMAQYCHLLFHLFFKPRAAAMISDRFSPEDT